MGYAVLVFIVVQVMPCRNKFLRTTIKRENLGGMMKVINLF